MTDNLMARAEEMARQTLSLLSELGKFHHHLIANDCAEGADLVLRAGQSIASLLDTLATMIARKENETVIEGQPKILH